MRNLSGRVHASGVVLWLLAGTPVGHAQDYRAGNRGWNGLSEFVASARSESLEVRAQGTIDLSRLKPTDALLVVYPLRAVPKADLAAFMYEGGRLAVADDFGASDALLDAFQIGRHAVAPDGALRLRENRNVLIATPRAGHPLSEGVRALVTNHPQVLHHRELDAIFGLGEQAGAVVLTGAVGKGRLVAISDPSVLINNMLEFNGNRLFARNLARYLAQGRRLVIAGPETTFTGHYGGLLVRDPFAVLRTTLQELASVRLPVRALRFTTAAITLLLLLFAATALPQRASLGRAVALAAPETLAGFAGRVRFFARPGHNLLAPLLAYKSDFDERLERALRTPEGSGGTRHVNLETALERAGGRRGELRRARAAVEELTRLGRTQGTHAEPPQVSRRKFHALVAAGDRILGALEPRER